MLFIEVGNYLLLAFVADSLVQSMLLTCPQVKFKIFPDNFAMKFGGKARKVSLVFLLVIEGVAVRPDSHSGQALSWVNGNN